MSSIILGEGLAPCPCSPYLPKAFLLFVLLLFRRFIAWDFPHVMSSSDYDVMCCPGRTGTKTGRSLLLTMEAPGGSSINGAQWAVFDSKICVYLLQFIHIANVYPRSRSWFRIFFILEVSSICLLFFWLVETTTYQTQHYLVLGHFRFEDLIWQWMQSGHVKDHLQLVVSPQVLRQSWKVVEERVMNNCFGLSGSRQLLMGMTL